MIILYKFLLYSSAWHILPWSLGALPGKLFVTAKKIFQPLSSYQYAWEVISLFQNYVITATPIKSQVQV